MRATFAAACTTPSSTTACPTRSRRSAPPAAGCSSPPPSRTTTPGPILEHFDLARHFAGIHGPELDGTNDHKADLIAHIIAQHGVAPETAIMIGDREFDVLAAARNGIRTVRRHLGLRQQRGARRRRRRRALRHAARLGLDHPGIDGSEGCQRPTISFCRTTRGLPSAISRSTRCATCRRPGLCGARYAQRR